MNAKKEITAEELVRQITWETLQDGEFSLNNAIIRGKLDLRHRVIQVAVTLRNCTFTGEVDLRYCEFKQRVDFSRSTFEKGFNSGDKTHDLTIYRKDLTCNDAVFEDSASFNRAQCEGTGFFHDVCFKNPKKEVDFGHARFGILECTGTTFKGGANFNGLQCEGSGFFRRVHFEDSNQKIKFGWAKFGVNLEFQSTIFAGEVDFQKVQVSGVAILRETKFQNRVNFNSATLNCLSLRNSETGFGSCSFPFEQKNVDLHRCTFEIFEGRKEQQEHMVKAQSPEKVSMDPYLQFEQYYLSIGDEAYAKKIYYEGRCALRDNALSGKNPEIKWSLWKMISDWASCWIVGYGVYMWVPFIWIFFFLCIGTGIFWNAEFIEKDAELISTLYELSNRTPPPKGNEDDNGNIFTRLSHGFWYSLDLFIPIVNLRLVDTYKRFHSWRAVYGVFHIVMGWILVPLLIASLSGVVKKYS